MDEEVMLLWVEQVLGPYVATAPDGVVPILFLDSYRCHMMASVVTKIQDLGVEVENIPGGAQACVNLLMSVSINHSRTVFENNGRHG